MIELKVADGIYYLVIVFNIGQSIDLKRAKELVATRLGMQTQMQFVPESRFFGYKPHPLRFNSKFERIEQASVNVQITVWDFGALSLCYQWPIPQEFQLSSLVKGSKELTQVFTQDAKKQAATMVEILKPSIFKPEVSDTFEDYPIYVINRYTENFNAEQLRHDYAPIIAKLLWQDENADSEQVVNAVFEGSFSASCYELVVVDWEGAFVYGPKHEDTCTVLEFALVQSLEMRTLLERLNDQLDTSYLKFNKTNSLYKTELKRLAQLSVEGAWAYESVADPLNLVGQRYLSHIYSIAAQQFKFTELDQDISRKLETLNDIYQKVQDRKTALSAHFLELIIIILIATEIIMALMK